MLLVLKELKKWIFKGIGRDKFKSDLAIGNDGVYIILYMAKKERFNNERMDKLINSLNFKN